MTLIFFSIWNLQIFTLSLILHLSWHHQEVARIQPLCKQATAWWIFFDKTFTKQKWSFNQAREALQGENIIISKSKKCRWCAAFFYDMVCLLHNISIATQHKKSAKVLVPQLSSSTPCPHLFCWTHTSHERCRCNIYCMTCSHCWLLSSSSRWALATQCVFLLPSLSTSGHSKLSCDKARCQELLDMVIMAATSKVAC